MNVISKISVDLIRANFGGRVNAMQCDGNTRLVEITLLAGGAPWTPPADAEAAIAYRQPGGTKGLYNKLADGTPAISINGNVATIILAPQMLTAPGTVQVSIVFNDAQLNQLTAFPFYVSVEKNPYAGAQKTEDYIRLQWLEDKLDEYIAKVGGGSTVDPEAVRQIVINYLTANPPTVTETDPTVPAWAKQPQKPTYTAKEVGALSAESLPAAINTALAQAKDSGAFDGAPGEDGYSPTASVTQTDTGAVVTITDKTGTTTATLKNGADGQPGTTGATPNIQIGTVETLEAGSSATASMTGTPENPVLNLGIPKGDPGTGGGSGIAVSGATVGQTVKISAVGDDGVPTAWEPVDFPSGDDVWERITEIDLTEEVGPIEISTDAYGNPFSLKKIYLHFYHPKYEGSSDLPNYSYTKINGNRTALYTSFVPSPSKTYFRVFTLEVEIRGDGFVQYITCSRDNLGGIELAMAQNQSWCRSLTQSYETINSIQFEPNVGILGFAGTHIAVYGVRV